MKTYRYFVLSVLTILPLTAKDENRGSTPSRDAVRIQPANQGISLKDLTTTRDINSLIAYSTTLSGTARDARVNTYKGRVTLRGVVETADEKQQIEKLAVSIAGPGNVNNELMVRSSLSKN